MRFGEDTRHLSSAVDSWRYNSDTREFVLVWVGNQNEYEYADITSYGFAAFLKNVADTNSYGKAANIFKKVHKVDLRVAKARRVIGDLSPAERRLVAAELARLGY